MMTSEQHSKPLWHSIAGQTVVRYLRDAGIVSLVTSWSVANASKLFEHLHLLDRWYMIQRPVNFSDASRINGKKNTSLPTVKRDPCRTMSRNFYMTTSKFRNSFDICGKRSTSSDKIEICFQIRLREKMPWSISDPSITPDQTCGQLKIK